MGSSTFYQTSTVKDPNQAYDDCHRAAALEFGTDPYNGSISTTTGVVVVQRAPVTKAVAERIIAKRIDDLSKWGPCEAIAVGTPTKSRTRTVKITVGPDEHGNARVDAAAVAAACKVSIEDLASWKVDASEPKYRLETRAAGPIERFWSVSGVRERFPTKTAAMAAAKAAAKAATEPPDRHLYGPQDMVRSPEPCVVRQHIERSPEAAVVPVLVKVRFTVTAELATGPMAFHHWLFYGWAAT